MNGSGDYAPAAVCIAIAAAMAVYWTADSVMSHWRRAKTAEQLATLKQQMLEKGLSADEIVRVIEARPGGKSTDADRA